MKIARILKVVVVIEWVLGFILGIITGVSGLAYSFEYYESGFNFWEMLFVWFIIFVSGMFQYGFAELLEHVDALRQRTDGQLYYLTAAVQRVEGAVLHNASSNSNDAGGNA